MPTEKGLESLQTVPEPPDDRLPALLERHGLALVGADSAKRVREWSPGAARLFGHTATEAMGRALSELFTRESGTQLSQWLDGLRQGRIEPSGPPLEWEACLKDGSSVAVRITINPVRDGFDLLVSAPPSGGALLKSEGFLRAVYDASDEIMILTDLDGRIVWSNAAWYRGLGYAPGARESLFDNIRAEDRERVCAAWADFRQRRAEFRDVSYRYRKGDGTEVWLETTIRLIPGHPYCYARSRNVTEKRLLEQAEERRARYLEATVGVVALTEEAPDASRIAGYLRERLRVDVVGLWIDGAPHGSREPTGLFEKPACLGAAVTEVLAALSARAGTNAISGDASAATAGAVVPLVGSEGDCRGALVLAGQTDRVEELALARNLATTLSLALERRQYMDGLARRAATESARADLGNALLQCSSQSEVLALVLGFFEKQHGLEQATLLLERPGGLEPVLAFAQGRGVPLSGALLAAAPAVSALMAEKGGGFARLPSGLPAFEAVRTDGCGEVAASAARALRLAGIGDRSAIGLRIPGVGLVYGVPVRPVLESELQGNAIVLDTVAAVIKQLRMEETRRRTLRKTEQVHHLEVEVRRLPVGRSKEKLRAIAIRLAEMTGAARVSILLRDERDRRRLRSVAAEERECRAASDPCLRTLYGGLAKLAFASGDPVFVAAPAQWGEIPGLPVGLRAHAPPATEFPPFYAGPIRCGAEQASGAFYVVGRESFEDTDFAIFHDVATIVGGTLKDEDLYRRQRELATRDELTRLHNRRYFMRRAAEWFRMARRYSKPFALALMDLDRFKSINDTYGHDCGDQALIELAGVLNGAVREVDVTARYGGEEFIALLPETAAEGARKTAERIRLAVEGHAFPWEGRELRLTVSCGVAVVGESSGDLDGGTYRVRCREAMLTAELPDGRELPLGITLVEAGDGARVREAVSCAAAGILSPGQAAHLQALARSVSSLEGMISTADARLYASKQAGRNRVTDGG